MRLEPAQTLLHGARDLTRPTPLADCRTEPSTPVGAPCGCNGDESRGVQREPSSWRAGSKTAKDRARVRSCGSVDLFVRHLRDQPALPARRSHRQRGTRRLMINTSAPAFSQACRRRIALSRLALPCRNPSARAVSKKGNPSLRVASTAAATRSVASPISSGSLSWPAPEGTSSVWLGD